MKRVNSALKSSSIKLVVLSLLTLCVQLAFAQTPGQRPNFDPLRGLKHALENAGAPALTSAQESSLTTLIKNYRDSNPPGPNNALRAAHKAYADAIAASDLAGAQAAATTIANLISTQTKTHLTAAANLAIQALAVLTPDQTEKLKAKFGSNGLAHLVSSLAGPGFGRLGGPGFGGPGWPGGPGGEAFGGRRGGQGTNGQAPSSNN